MAPFSNTIWGKSTLPSTEVKLKFDSQDCNYELFGEVKPIALVLHPDRTTVLFKYEIPEWDEENSHYVDFESEKERVESELDTFSLDELFNILSAL